MKKSVLLLAALVVLSGVAFAQSVNDDFGSMSGWTPGAGDWVVRAGRLMQQDSGALLAKADRMVEQSGIVEYEFAIRYVDGAYASQMDLEQGVFHAGFGMHVGVENPRLGKETWGNGDSYLLWLNLDTRDKTRREYPEHYGFRAQVYRSEGPTTMYLVKDSRLSQDAALRRVTRDNYASFDIVAALNMWGYDVDLSDFARFLNETVPINIRVNYRTGQIGVKDPTAPIRLWFDVDPAVLRGDYVALRSNSLAVSYDYFRAE